MKPTSTTGSTGGGPFHRVVVVLGIALMTIVAAGQAVQEGLTKINLDALPPLTGGFQVWVVVSYTVVAAGFLWIGFVLARRVPRCMAVPGSTDRNTGAERVDGEGLDSAGASSSPSS